MNGNGPCSDSDPLPPCACACAAAGIAAFGCMRALNTLLESVASRPEVFVALEEILCPLMHTMISTNGQDIFEEVRACRHAAMPPD